MADVALRAILCNNSNDSSSFALQNARVCAYMTKASTCVFSAEKHGKRERDNTEKNSTTQNEMRVQWQLRDD